MAQSDGPRVGMSDGALIDIRRLEIFCRVVEQQSFTRAAEATLLAQPTVSEHIRLLEESLGEKLLDRLGRQVLPTPAGDILYRYARRMLRLRDEAVQALADYRGKLSGHLTIGASTIPGAYLLPQLIRRFKEHHPEIRLTLRIAGSGRIRQDLAQGELELAIIGDQGRHPDLTAREIFSDELILAAPPGHPLSRQDSVAPADLCRHPFLMREEGSGTRGVMARALGEAGFDPARLDVVAEMGSSDAIRQGIKAGLGISILSNLALEEDLKNGALARIPLAGVPMTRPFYLVQRKNRRLTPLAQTFLDFLPAHP